MNEAILSRLKKVAERLKNERFFERMATVLENSRETFIVDLLFHQLF